MNNRATGDSITAGTGASVSANSYVNRLGTWLPAFQNFGVSTRMALDASGTLYSLSPAVAAGDTSIVMFGTNDEAQYATDAAKLDYYIDAMRGHAIYQSAVTKAATSANGVTYTGSWSGAAFSSYGTQTAGDKASFNITGESVALGMLCQYPNTSTFQVKIDSVVKGTYSTGGANIDTILGQAYGVMCLAFGSLGAGTHTVEIDVLTGGTNQVTYLQWFSDCTPLAKVILNNTPHALTFIGALSNGSVANINTYNSALAALGTELQGYGLDVTVVDVCSLLTISDISADGVHPNDSGHLKIATADYTAITGLIPPPTLMATTCYSGSDGNAYIAVSGVVHKLTLSS